MNHEYHDDFEINEEEILEFFRNLPQPQIKVLNLKRFAQMFQAARKLMTLMQKSIPEGEIEINIDRDFNLGSISVEFDDMIADAPMDFAEIISCADNFEIYPLTNGKARLDITFQSVLKSVY